jgi:hypothetical protein
VASRTARPGPFCAIPSQKKAYIAQSPAFECQEPTKTAAKRGRATRQVTGETVAASFAAYRWGTCSGFRDFFVAGG